MRVHVLGSAAGGGFPQWNCGCQNCDGQRRGLIPARARTQTSLAVSADGQSWFLLHASPDIRMQIECCSHLHPRNRRDSPIAGILLTNGDLDQVLGLLSLRESHPLHIYATDRVRYGLTEGNTIYRTLGRIPEQVTWHALKLSVKDQALLTTEGLPSGLTVTALAVPGKVPLHLEESLPSDEEDNIGLLIRESQSERTLAFLPSVAGPHPNVMTLLQAADCILFDGTFWTNDELAMLGVGTRSAKDMAHWPISGPSGSLRMLSDLQLRRRILVHLNNTNPLLDEGSHARQEVDAAGVEVAYDGMELMI